MKSISIPLGNSHLKGIIHYPSCPTDKTLIISHGFRGTKDGGGRAVTLAETIAATGVNVIRYDFTPLQNLSCQISELTAVINYTRHTIGGHLFLLGRSMGGCASLAAAALDQKICGLILWATPWDLTTTFRLALGAHYDRLIAGESVRLVDEFGSLFLTPDFIHDFQHHDLLACVECLGQTPLLILQGTADAIVPVNQARTIYQQSVGPRELVLYQDGDHHLTLSTMQASATISAWLSKL
jgi:putative redox protein